MATGRCLSQLFLGAGADCRNKRCWLKMGDGSGGAWATHMAMVHGHLHGEDAWATYMGGRMGTSHGGGTWAPCKGILAGGLCCTRVHVFSDTILTSNLSCICLPMWDPGYRGNLDVSNIEEQHERCKPRHAAIIDVAAG